MHIRMVDFYDSFDSDNTNSANINNSALVSKEIGVSRKIDLHGVRKVSLLKQGDKGSRLYDYKSYVVATVTAN